MSLTIALTLAGCSGAATTAPSRGDTRVDMKPLQARAAYERALTHLRDAQPGAALSALQEATTLDPKSALYANTLGVLLLQQFRNIAGAVPWLKRAVELDPTYGDAQLNYAIALAEAARWEDAIDGYRKALRLPTLTTPHIAHQNLGVALFNLKRYPEAEQSLRYALTLEPQMVGTHYNLGLVLLALGRQAEAVAAFRRERELAPPESSFNRAAADRLKALGAGG